MTLNEIVIAGIDPALKLLPAQMNTFAAQVQLLVTGLQESRFEYRAQKILGNPKAKGPARGFWQFEKGGGVTGVLTCKVTAEQAKKICLIRHVQDTPVAVWHALEFDDVLAAAFARLLIWSDPPPLPTVGDADGAWDLYIRTWQPGKPRRETWDDFYQQALTEVFE